MRRWLQVLGGLVLFTAYGVVAQEGDIGKELIQNGDFALDENKDGWPDGWGRSGSITRVEEGGKRWIHLVSPSDKGSAVASQDVPLQPDWFKLKLTFRMRSKDIVQGKEGWHNARLAMCFQGPDGKKVGDWPNVFEMRGSNDWTPCERVYRIPPGAVKLSFSPAIFSAAGEADYADISLKMIGLRPKWEDAKLPPGVEARWDYDGAWKQTSRTRERVCINGLWRFIPAKLDDKTVPDTGKGWGYLKVPGCWPRAATWEQASFQPIAPEIWEQAFDFREVEAGWYQREITIPSSWANRRVFLDMDNVQTDARVMVDGQEAGMLSWPGGRLDITGKAAPGKTATLTVFVKSVPDDLENLVVMGPDVLSKAKAEINVRGLAGDCYLESEPQGARITDAFLQPSVTKKCLTTRLEFGGLDPARKYRIEGTILLNGQEVKAFASPAFSAGEVEKGFTVSEPWDAPALWDVDEGNLHTALLRLCAEDGTVCDEALPVEFGFREFGIEGRNFVLNGTVAHLFALVYNNHLPRWGRMTSGDVEGAGVTFRRMREMNFNFAILGNYDFERGTMLSLDDTVRTADRMGFPLSFSLRHIKHSYQHFDDPKVREKHERLVEYCVRRYRNHPSVLMWAMDHNFLGYSGDQNPARLDGVYVPDRDEKGWRMRRDVAAKAEAFVHSLDPTRPAYHHESGFCGQMITLNCYLNWTPLQDRMEWLSHWAEAGRVPIFFVELGLPHVATWGRHRGAPFIWRNLVSSEPLVVEFAAMHKGDAAYHLTAQDLEHIETVEKIYGRGEPFHYSAIMGKYWSEARENNFVELQSMFTRHTWPAWRTWGAPAILPWDQDEVARAKGRPAESVVAGKTDWRALQRPGMSLDCRPVVANYYQQPSNDPYLEPSSLYHVFREYNAPLFAYIAGKKDRFTSRDHNFCPGEKVCKQLIVINDSRRTIRAQYEWRAQIGPKVLAKGEGAASVATGTSFKAPFEFSLPGDASGECTISATVRDAEGRFPPVGDRFLVDILPRPRRPQMAPPIAIYDPYGQWKTTLRQLAVPFDRVDPDSDLSKHKLLILGRNALGVDRPRFDLKECVNKGLTVLLFEQREEVLLKRFGFRTASPTARSVFIRQVGPGGNPMAAGLEDRHLCNWRGEGTLLDPYPKTEGFEKTYPTADWCGFRNTRTWKWGNYGSVASVLIEKPHTGDFMPYADCEFDLQYSPLMEFREGKGRVIFCQFDLTARTENDPAGNTILRNLLAYAAGDHAPRTTRRCFYAGGSKGKDVLTRLRIRVEPTDDLSKLGPGDLLLVGEGAAPGLRSAKDSIQKAVGAGAIVFSLPKTPEELQGWLPFEVKTERKFVTHTIVDNRTSPLLAGLGNSDFHWRGRIAVDAIATRPEGSDALPTGIVQSVPHGKGQYVLCQVSPDLFKYDDFKTSYLKLSAQRCSFMLSRMLANLGAPSEVPLLDYLERPAFLPVDLTGEWKGMADREKQGDRAGFVKAEFDDSQWRAIRVPGSWEEQLADLKNYDGVFWYRRAFDAPTIPKEPMTLEINGVDDEDWTYLNGRLIGHIGQDTNPQDYWKAVRSYAIPEGLLKEKGNVLAIKVNDLRQAGGIMNAPVQIRVPSRWLVSYYVNEPIATDDAYRYDRW